MKELKIWGIMLLAVMMMQLVASCGGDDDNNGSGGSDKPVSIEGTWHSKSQIWYSWNEQENAPNYSKSYTMNNDEIWIFTKNGDNYNWRYIYTDKGRDYDENRELIRNKDNDFRVMKGGSSYSRIVFKTITANSIELEYWDGYYRKDGTAEYGIVNLVK